MYFVNETTEAVTKEDNALHLQVCIMLRAFCFVGARQARTNPNWSMLQVDCHAIARVISLIFKNLTLVDGYIIGLRINPGENTATIVHTDHSWLRTPSGAILDPYPMGLISTTSALLIPTTGTRYTAHGSNFYHENAKVQSGFDVTYELDGVQKVVRMDRDPGKRIPVEDGELVLSQS